MDKVVDKAVQFVDDVLSHECGNEFMYIGGIYHSLVLASSELMNPLSKEELIKLTERIYEACSSSTVPVLTAERADAVCFMLEYGISPNRSPEFISLNPDATKKFLLSCDMEVFVDLVDAVAVDGHDYYSADFDLLNSDFIGRINAAIGSAIDNKPKLETVMKTAEQIGEARRDESVSEVQTGRIWDATNERYI